MGREEIINKYFPVLDNGFVSFVDSMGGDEDIVRAARVSYGEGTKVVNSDKSLIRYLLNHKHTTPFEMVVFKFHISMPTHTHRQFIRHRMSTTNEYSARYSIVPEVTYDEYALNQQSKNNKQGRNDNVVENEEELLQRRDKIHNDAFQLYQEMVDAGVAREIARMHLPLNMYTYFYWKIDLHNLLHFLKLRCDSHAQYEIRQFANVLAGVVKEVCPIAFEAWEDYSFHASNFSRLDKKFLGYCLRNLEYTQTEQRDIDAALFKTLYEQLYLCEGKYLGNSPHKRYGMSDREVGEFWNKLEVPESVDFTLDVSKAKDASFYENLVKENT